jgi:Type I phosphodiesterase / nucleotide pyrophosphatase
MIPRSSRSTSFSPGAIILRQLFTMFILIIVLAISLAFLSIELPPQSLKARSTLVLIWDGMRPDMVSAVTTPNLYSLGQRGIIAIDNHATYPTTNLVNDATLISGLYPGGFQPTPTGDGSGTLSATETATTGHGIISDTPFLAKGTSNITIPQPETPTPSLTATTTVTPASPTPSAPNVPTSTVTASPTPIVNKTPTPPRTVTPTPTSTPTPQPATSGIIDLTNTSNQLALNSQLTDGLITGTTLAKDAINAGLNVSLAGTKGSAIIQAGSLLKQTHSNLYVIDDQFNYPTSLSNDLRNADISIPDPQQTGDTNQRTVTNNLLTDSFLKVLLPHFQATNTPFLSVIDYPDPYATATTTGLGSQTMVDSLQAVDQELGRILNAINQGGWNDSINIIVTSGHGMSVVGGPDTTSSSDHTLDIASLMSNAIHNGTLPDVGIHGISTGKITSDTTVILDTTGGVSQIYLPTTPALLAIGDGDGNLARHKLVAELVKWLQSVAHIGPIFINDTYSGIDGTFTLSQIGLAGILSPALMFSFETHGKEIGLPGINEWRYGGTTFAATSSLAMAGTFSRRDLHSILFAIGPSFKSQVRDPAPTGIADLAPTLATILGIQMTVDKNHARVLSELLVNGPDTLPSIDTRQLVSTVANVNGQSYYEIVDLEVADHVIYIHDAAGGRADASSAPGLQIQVQTSAREE